MAGASPTPTPGGIASFPVLRQNPYQRLLYEHLEGYGLGPAWEGELKLFWLLRHRTNVDILHFHWPQNYYYWLGRPDWARRPLSWLRVGLLAGRLTVARLLGYRVVWTIHQLRPHESLGARLDGAAASLLARASSALVAHDRPTAQRAERALGLAAGSVVVLPHGSYEDVYPPGRERRAVRRELDLPDDAFIFLSFGHLRGYKETTHLLEAFSSVDDPDLRLVIAGLPLDEPSRMQARRAARDDSRIRVLLDFVPEERVAELFAACDACVFARRDGGTSGALVLALSLATPVVAADVEAYRELLRGGEAGWLFDIGDEDSLSSALRRAGSERDTAAVKAEAARRIAGDLSWEGLAPRYAAVLGDLDLRSTGA